MQFEAEDWTRVSSCSFNLKIDIEFKVAASCGNEETLSFIKRLGIRIFGGLGIFFRTFEAEPKNMYGTYFESNIKIEYSSLN